MATFYRGNTGFRWSFPEAPIRGFEQEWICGDRTVTRFFNKEPLSVDPDGTCHYEDELTYEENRGDRDFASRSVTIRVRALGSNGQPYSEWYQETATNDAPVITTLPQVSTDFERALISLAALGEPDFVGYVVHAGDTADFTPSETTLVTEGAGPSFWIDLPEDNPTRFVKVAPYDIFGKSDLAYFDVGAVTRQSLNSAVSATQAFSDLQETYGTTVAAAQSAADAAEARNEAIQARVDAVVARGGAQSAAQDALSRATDAASSRDAAETARGQAETYRNEAASSAEDAEGHAATASTQAGLAAGSANTAGDSAEAAAGSASLAETRADEAGVSASAANAAKVAAEAARNDSEGHASAASEQASSAAAHADEASQSASAAETARNLAETARGRAETYRNEAASSAEDAEGHAATASTQAGLAAGSANEAGLSASAANTSAGQASTYADEAESAANASAESAVKASSSFADAVRLVRNPDFNLGKAGWYDIDLTTFVVAESGRKNLLQTTVGVNSTVTSELIPLTSGASYRVSAGWRTVSGSTPVQFYCGVFFFDASGVLVAATDGTGNYPISAGHFFTPGDGWIDRSVLIGPAAPLSPYGGTVSIPADAAQAQLVWYYNYNSVADAQASLDYLRIEIATGEANAAQSANAAAIHSSNASSSSSAAGSEATAAQTARAGAETAMGQAESYRNEAVQAVEDAEGHASTASQQADLSADSAAQAGNHASAAQGHAQTASTQSSAASSAASASEASRIAATATYRDTVLVGGDTDFQQGTSAWGSTATPAPAEFSSSQAVYHTAFEGRYGVLEFNSGAYVGLYSRKLWAIDTNRKYRIKAHVFVGPNGSGLTYIGFRDLFADGTPSAGNTAHHYNVVSAQHLTPGWHELSSPILTGEGGENSPYQFNPGAKLLQLQSLTNYNGEAGKSIAFDRFWIEDVTESETAAGHANAAQIAVTTAEAHADDAGEYAGIASGHASAANTSAGEALIYRNEAATSASSAAGSATSAATSAMLSASLATSALNFNPTYQEWSSPVTLSQWSNWDSNLGAGSALTRVAGENGIGYAVQLTGGVGMPAYFAQKTAWGTAAAGYYVIEAHVRLDAGNLLSAGIYNYTRGDNGNENTDYFAFAGSPDQTGVAPGAGVVGRTYRFAKLVHYPTVSPNSAFVLYTMTNWSGFGPQNETTTLTWFRNSIRPATESEIELRQARNGSASVGARISLEEGVRASADSALGSRASTLEAQMNGTSDSNLRARIIGLETVTTDGRFASASSLSNLSATVGDHTSTLSTHANALATLDGETRARWAIGAAVPGATAFIEARAETVAGQPPTSDVAIGARQFAVYNPNGADWRKALEVINGNVVLTGGLQAGAFIRLGNGQGWPVALRAVDFNASDGEVVNFGTDLGSIPSLTFAMTGLAPLTAGESYDVKAVDLTATGFTLYAKINVPAVPSSQTTTGSPSSVTVGGYSGTQRSIAGLPYSVDGTFHINASGLQNHRVYPNGGGAIEEGNESYASSYVAVYALKGGVWTYITTLYADSMADADDYWETHPITVSASWFINESVQIGTGATAIALAYTGSSNGLGGYVSSFGQITWTSQGAGSSVRSATPDGQKTRITVRPQ